MEWTDLVSNVAFPIAVAGYLLVSMRKAIDGLTKSITANTKLVQEACEELKRASLRR